MRANGYAGVVVVTCLAALPARGDSVDATLTTLLTGHADPRDGQLHTIVPIYESLAAQAVLRRDWADELKLTFSGWGNMTLDIPLTQTWTGDIDVGYLEGAFLRRRIDVRLGRQFVTGGAARASQVDGLDITLRGPGGVGLAVYGGLPVTPRFGTPRGDAVFGGRAFYRYSIDAEAGVSFNQVLGLGRVARQDFGVDLRYAPHRTVTLTGFVILSLKEVRVAEADAMVLWQPREMLQMSVDYRRTAPDLFLPLNSIFAVFSQETRDEVGGDVYLRPLPRLRLSGDYHVILREDGAGHRGGGKLSAALGRRQQSSVNAEVRVLKEPLNGYVQARLYGICHPLPQFLATVGTDVYFLDRPINGQGYSFTANAAAGYEVSPSLRLMLSGMADVTPFVQRRFEFVARLAYNFTRRFHEVRP